MKLNAPIIIKESFGITRMQEPVTVGIPMPKGALTHNEQLLLMGRNQLAVPLQTTPLARWDDGSIKWILLDFQADIKGGEEQKLLLRTTADSVLTATSTVTIKDGQEKIIVDTGAAVFHIPTDVFKPFSQVLIDGQDFLINKSSTTVLIDSNDHEGMPVISNVEWEIRGPLRSTLKMNGEFLNSEQKEQLSFVARLSFFTGLSTCKVDFTLWNPRAAAHPGGLWDLGDPGSFYFKDLSLSLFPKLDGDDTTISWKERADAVSRSIENSNLLIYQDSSGGENWQSRNHVNRNNEVKTSFRGYKVVSADREISDGLRAQPIITLADGEKNISASIRCFWQNFPKALEADKEKIAIRFFPHQFADIFEMQGGERKTHTCFLHFQKCGPERDIAGWVHGPLEARSTPAWYAGSQAVSYLVPEECSFAKKLSSLVQPAVEGDNTFFHRREIIDEYGWRNFGDWYADHEAVGYQGTPPLISHYNNQYDGICGTLCRYLVTGDYRWYILGDELCRHVRDIDIYHTDKDRPEFNRGLFWHTEHYLNVETATHRCFSRHHAQFRNLSCYGGGPALSHSYALGLLYHYFLTGEPDSREAVLDLAEFVMQTLKSRSTLMYLLMSAVRKAGGVIRRMRHGQALVDFTKVYGLDGPGRSAGNSLSTLLTAYELTGQERFLAVSEAIISTCIHPEDDIEGMDMLDIENRWMYTVFLQALGRYLDLTEDHEVACLREYARECLLHYGRWMVRSEFLYLTAPQKLEFPNETWAAQEIRKCNVLLYAAKYSLPGETHVFRQKADFFYQGCLGQLQSRPTRQLTRPITLLLQNCHMMAYFRPDIDCSAEQSPEAESRQQASLRCPLPKNRLLRQLRHTLLTFSLRDELDFIRYRLP